MLPDWVFDAIDASPRSWNWLIRLHPRQTQQRAEIEREFEGRCHSASYVIETANDGLLPTLLTAADVHVTYSSTVVLEAAAFGVPSVVLSQDAKQMYEPLFRSGHVVLAESKETLLQQIIRQANRSVERLSYPSKDVIAFICEMLDTTSGQHAHTSRNAALNRKRS
jgi:predicted glycosyltransferase